MPETNNDNLIERLTAHNNELRTLLTSALEPEVRIQTPHGHFMGTMTTEASGKVVYSRELTYRLDTMRAELTSRPPQTVSVSYRNDSSMLKQLADAKTSVSCMKMDLSYARGQIRVRENWIIFLFGYGVLATLGLFVGLC